MQPPCRDITYAHESRLLLSHEEIWDLRNAGVDVNSPYIEFVYASTIVPEWVMKANDLWRASVDFADMTWIEFILKLKPEN